MNPSTWTVVLAAGAGRRLTTVTGGVPKQFWRGPGGVSLLQQTVDRFAPVAPGSRTVVIIDRRHRDHISVLPGGIAEVVVQPEDRGTAAGVLLALMPVIDSSPDAVAVITPADHGVMDAMGFQQTVRDAAEYVHHNDGIVLFGVEPTSARPDYGWISLAPKGAGTAFRRVEGFTEKPGPDVATRLFDSGAIWNTMVLVGRAGTVRDLCSGLAPALGEVFATASELPVSIRAGYLATIYPTLPRFDFSRDELGRAPELLAHVWPASLGWSDLGTPERLCEWDQRSGALGAMATTTAA